MTPKIVLNLLQYAVTKNLKYKEYTTLPLTPATVLISFPRKILFLVELVCKFLLLSGKNAATSLTILCP